MHKLFLSIVWCVGCLCLTANVQAQNYSSDAILVSRTENTAIVQSSGTNPKKKTAVEAAVKSALYTYLFTGIEGLNNGKPLLGRKPSQAAIDYANNILNTRYSVFVKEYILDEKTSKDIGKQFKAIVNVEIYDGALYRELVKNKLIGEAADKMTLSDTQDEISLPSIMVVPYCANGEDFSHAIQKNSDIRVAMSKVAEGFIEKGVNTKNVEQSLRNAANYQATKDNVSLNDMIISNSGADVMVYVDVVKDATAEGMRITMRLQAIDVATSKEIASKSETSGRKNAGADIICGALANVMLDDFLKQISTNMARKIAAGNSISIIFTAGADSDISMDMEVGNEFLPLSDAIVRWVKANAKGSKYHQKGRSETMLELDEIQIANKSADGQDMDINDFSLSLYQYLRGLNLTVKRNIVGNTIEITLL